jgi:2,3-bisphosphoglycerate-independent phosphoglycerate mutase
MVKNAPAFVCLIVLDGWGIASAGPGNAITQANTLNFNRFWVGYPHTQLLASGEAVGLPRGEAGNTETGHLNLGAGRIVYQDLERINLAIADGSFSENPIFKKAVGHALENNARVHLLGLVGASGIHSNLEHLFALVSFFAKTELKDRLFLHLFTDGRDSPPTSSVTYLKKIEETLGQEKAGRIASVMGRYYAMDRDRRWDRTAKAYFALTRGEGFLVKTPEEAVSISYRNGKTDEFIEPFLMTGPDGKPVALISDNDVIIFFNFRVDRPRQLTAAFIVSDFREQSLALEFDPFLERYAKTHLVQRVAGYQQVFERGPALKNHFFVTMTEYSRSLTEAGAKPAFPPRPVELPLGVVLAENDKQQLRLAESEKERFVTYYFNGLREDPFPGEKRLILPSPNVPTYDLKPEMAALEITQTLLNQLVNPAKYDFILLNFANPDMVAHTGSIGPTVKACEVLDECLGKIVNQVLAFNGGVLITGDHGNAEEMINNQTGQIDTEHNGNPVPFLAIAKQFAGRGSVLPSGILADIAPTVLGLLNLPQPSLMTGKNLLAGF